MYNIPISSGLRNFEVACRQLPSSPFLVIGLPVVSNQAFILLLCCLHVKIYMTTMQLIWVVHKLCNVNSPQAHFFQKFPGWLASIKWVTILLLFLIQQKQ